MMSFAVDINTSLCLVYFDLHDKGHFQTNFIHSIFNYLIHVGRLPVGVVYLSTVLEYISERNIILFTPTFPFKMLLLIEYFYIVVLLFLL